MDFLLGHFAENTLGSLSADELEALEDILMCDDAPLYAFLAQNGPLPEACETPARRALLARIRESVRR